jgi:Spy/CpxP family protein refolding chaperone
VKPLAIFVTYFLISTSCLTAQSTDETIQAYNNAIQAYGDAVQQLQRANLRTQKREIINKSLSLTAEQSKKFWPIYDKNEAELTRINDRRLALINDYVSYKSGIPSEKAAELINSIMQIQQDRHELKRRYVKEMGTVLTGKQALRLLLLENQIDLQIEAQIAAQIPL